MPARILIVEDNPVNLELMRYLLEAHGHLVSDARDGEQGLEAARRETPDLILCDVLMPRLDGFEVARRLKRLPELQRVPLVAVTALAMRGDRERVLGAGFDAYLPKPIDPVTFVNQVEALLPIVRKGTPPRVARIRSTLSSFGVRKATLLVVDDQPVNLDLARSILEPFGYVVLSAATVPEGLEVARRKKPSLILSDVNLSGGACGTELVRAVRADPELRDLALVLITSTSFDPETRIRALQAGADRFLQRPIEPDVLLAEVQACLRERRRV
jgi:two-component system cell cycle response regulator